MVKEALFSRNDNAMLEHLPRAHFEPDYFENDIVRRQARSRLRRKIENEATPFLLTHLHEWQGIDTALEYGLIDDEVKTKLQSQIWDDNEELIRFLLRWIPNDKLGEFLGHLFVDSYPDELTDRNGRKDPLAPMSFWGPYISQLEFEDKDIERLRQRLERDLASFSQLTASKRSIVRMDIKDDHLRINNWMMKPEQYDNLMAYDNLDDTASFAYVIPGSIFEQEGNKFVKVFYCSIQWHQWIMNVAYMRHYEGKRPVGYNHLMNTASQYISWHIRDHLLPDPENDRNLENNQNRMIKYLDKTILQLMNEYFDHYRTNMPGRPSAKRKGAVEDEIDVYYDKEIASFIEFLEQRGRKGREVPIDKLGNPDPGEGRGFKGFLRKRINELIKMDFLDPVGKGFTISEEGLDVHRHRNLPGITNVIAYTSFDQIESDLRRNIQKHPESPEDEILRSIMIADFPDAAVLNIDQVLSMIMQDLSSQQSTSDHEGGPVDTP